MKRSSFILHLDSLQILDDMTTEQRANLLMAIRAYHSEEQMPELDWGMRMALAPFIKQFERDQEKYVNTCERNRNNGSKPKKRLGAKKASGLSGMPLEAKQAENDNDNEHDCETVMVNGHAKGATKSKVYVKRFIEPSQDEVNAYAAEIGKQGLVDGFVDFYASKGWLVGKAPMKDWKASVRRWTKDKQPTTTPQTTDNDGYYQARALPSPDWAKELAMKTKRIGEITL